MPAEVLFGCPAIALLVLYGMGLWSLRRKRTAE
jgi:hypothetical protein